MLSVLNLMILRLDVDSVEDFADFGSAGANPVDHSMIFGARGPVGSLGPWAFGPGPLGLGPWALGPGPRTKPKGSGPKAQGPTVPRVSQRKRYGVAQTFRFDFFT